MSHMRRFITGTALAVLFFVCAGSRHVSATHIVGGDFTCRWLSGNTFEVKLVLYRDMNGLAPFDQTILVGIFNKGNNQLVDSVYIDLLLSDSLEFSGDCEIPPEVQVEQGVYIDTIILANNPAGYYLSWERCCRNHSVVNIFDPGATGMVFYMEVADPALQNSSPVLLNAPLPFMCEQQPWVYNFGGFDADGDVLVYSLVDPLKGHTGNGIGGNLPPILNALMPAPYIPITWESGYSLANVCGGTPLAVDAVTGTITATPAYTGLYAMAIEVREFRNGVQIGLIRREIEFYVILCSDNSSPYINLATSVAPVMSGGNALYEITATDTICFSITIDDFGDSIFFSHEGDVFQGGIIDPPFATINDTIGTDQVTSTFCWNTTCAHINGDPYKIIFKAMDDGCPLPFTTVDTVLIKVNPPPEIEPVNLLCLQLIGNDVVNIVWGDTAVSARYFGYYLIYRSVNGSPYSVYDTVFDRFAGQYTDTDAFMHSANDYCYFVSGVDLCGYEWKPSDTLCTITEMNTNVNYLQTATVESENTIRVTWEYFPDAYYSDFYLHKKENDAGAAWALMDTFASPVFLVWKDYDVVTSQKSYCYMLQNRNKCDNLSPESNDACTILLKGEAKPFVNYLKWSPYKTWRGEVDRYEVWRKSNGIAGYKKIGVTSSSVFEFSDSDFDYAGGLYSYFIKGAEGGNGFIAESNSNEISLSQEPSVFFPNAFTPNGDATNDTWMPATVFVKDFELLIFNRYGQQVFNSTTIGKGWDGTFLDKPVPQGIYTFVAEFTGYEGYNNTRKRTGTIALIR